MAKGDRVKDATGEDTAIPEPRSAQESQVVPVGNMDTDPRTGATLKVGIPETDDEADVADFILWLSESADASNVDEMDMLVETLRRANTAQSLADALREKTTINGRDHRDKPFMCTGFTIREGKYEEETIPYYASLECIDPDRPEGFIVNCGGMKILVHLRSMERFNAFPIPLAIRGVTNKRGRTPLSFEVLQQQK